MLSSSSMFLFPSYPPTKSNIITQCRVHSNSLRNSLFDGLSISGHLFLPVYTGMQGCFFHVFASFSQKHSHFVSTFCSSQKHHTVWSLASSPSFTVCFPDPLYLQDPQLYEKAHNSTFLLLLGCCEDQVRMCRVARHGAWNTASI